MDLSSFDEIRHRPHPGVFYVKRCFSAWWAQTAGPEFLSSRCSCRDAWVVLLPLYVPVAMCLEAAAMQGNGASTSSIVEPSSDIGAPLRGTSNMIFAIDVAVSVALLLASLLPRRTVMSDFCTSAIFGTHLVCQKLALGVEAQAPLGVYQLVATVAMTSAGVHSLAVAAFLGACAAASRRPELLVCGYVLGAAALSEHRVALLFANKAASSYKVLSTFPAEDVSPARTCDTLQLSGGELCGVKTDDVGCTRRNSAGISPTKFVLPHEGQLPLLVLNPERELVFGSAANNCVLKLANLSHGFVAYTVRARQQHVWHVRPHSGTLAKGQSVDVTISRKDRRLTVAAGASRDELVVRAAVRESPDAVPTHVWRTMPREAMQEWSYGVRRGDVCGDALAAARAFATQTVMSPTSLGRTPDCEKSDV